MTYDKIMSPLPHYCLYYVLSIQVELSLDEHVCELPMDKRKQTVTYAFIGFGQVTIEVDPICSCGCENQKEGNSSSCSNRGALVCSVCDCDAGYQGESLE